MTALNITTVTDTFNVGTSTKTYHVYTVAAAPIPPATTTNLVDVMLDIDEIATILTIGVNKQWIRDMVLLNQSDDSIISAASAQLGLVKLVDLKTLYGFLYISKKFYDLPPRQFIYSDLVHNFILHLSTFVSRIENQRIQALIDGGGTDPGLEVAVDAFIQSMAVHFSKTYSNDREQALTEIEQDVVSQSGGSQIKTIDIEIFDGMNSGALFQRAQDQQWSAFTGDMNISWRDSWQIPVNANQVAQAISVATHKNFICDFKDTKANDYTTSLLSPAYTQKEADIIDISFENCEVIGTNLRPFAINHGKLTFELSGRFADFSLAANQNTVMTSIFTRFSQQAILTELTLNFNGSRFNNQAIGVLFDNMNASLPLLKILSIDVSHNDVGSWQGTLIPFANMPALRDLSLKMKGCKLQDTDLASLFASSTLSALERLTIDLEQNRLITATGLNTVCALFIPMAVKSISLKLPTVTDVQWQATLGQVLPSKTNLEQIELRFDNMQPNFVQNVMQGAQASANTLTKLILDPVNAAAPSLAGSANFGAALQTLSKLQTLSLQFGSQTSTKDASVIISALASRTTLVNLDLDLSYSILTDVSLTQLGTIIGANILLQTLRVAIHDSDASLIGIQGLLAGIPTISTGHKLTYLALDFTNVTTQTQPLPGETITALITGLNSTTSLKEIDLRLGPYVFTPGTAGNICAQIAQTIYKNTGLLKEKIVLTNDGSDGNLIAYFMNTDPAQIVSLETIDFTCNQDVWPAQADAIKGFATMMSKFGSMRNARLSCDLPATIDYGPLIELISTNISLFSLELDLPLAAMPPDIQRGSFSSLIPFNAMRKFQQTIVSNSQTSPSPLYLVGITDMKALQEISLKFKQYPTPDQTEQVLPNVFSTFYFLQMLRKITLDASNIGVVASDLATFTTLPQSLNKPQKLKELDISIKDTPDATQQDVQGLLDLFSNSKFNLKRGSLDLRGVTVASTMQTQITAAVDAAYAAYGIELQVLV